MAEAEIPVELVRIVINEQSPEQVIVLREIGGERQFPIVIGIFEAWAIDRKVKGVDMPRPMTHDLLANVVDALGGQLVRVVVNALDGSTFFAQLVVRQNESDISIDCRPSDAVALAVRGGVPMFVSREVFDKLSP